MHMESAQGARRYESAATLDKRFPPSGVTATRLLLLLVLGHHLLTAHLLGFRRVEAGVLLRVCDTREIKTVTNRVCMLYKRTRNSEVKLDKNGYLRMTRAAKGEFTPAKLATECCKVGCPPHIFAYNC